MKKNLLILLGIFILIIAILFFIYNNYIKVIILSQQSNKEYENYTENTVLGSSLMTLINKAIDRNEKNGIEKNNKNLYIENNENSIKIEIKFLESDKIFQMETISDLGSEEFIKNYNSRKFKCTKKEYHEKTKHIKYILFEEI